MNFESSQRSSRQSTVSFILSALLLATSLALLGLSANTLAVWNAGFSPTRWIKLAFHEHDAAFAPDSRTTIAYWTSDVKLDDTRAYLAASILGLLLGSAAVAITVRGRKMPGFKLAVSGQDTYSISFKRLPSPFAIDICLLIITFIATCLAWVRWSTAAWIIDKQSFIPNTSNRLFYYSGLEQTLESWNCVIARNVAPDARRRTASEMRSLCLQGRAERALILVLLALVLMRVAMVPAEHILEWKRGRVLARKRGSSENRMVELKNRAVDLESQEDESRASAEEPKEMQGTASIAELPADRTSEVEMDGDLDLKELPSDHGWKELEAGVAAVETEAVEPKQDKDEKT